MIAITIAKSVDGKITGLYVGDNPVEAESAADACKDAQEVHVYRNPVPMTRRFPLALSQDAKREAAQAKLDAQKAEATARAEAEAAEKAHADAVKAHEAAQKKLAKFKK